MRSPVFAAELYGPMAEDTRQSIAIEDMHPEVFRSLLHFIYTDAMPVMEDCSVDDRQKIIKHLLVAADSSTPATPLHSSSTLSTLEKCWSY
ncbi:hypothetical protein BAE44_0002347 [Dichanthelium oligosanthes]|uniref:BTB domain-containing protein n=1 Tax=Dichanthelium oligosanthes TaxID=888268 RepID=A0A1E5WH14_9POAL|nr:hypothetical protein BAE44_0002347 [Dichanthelium oligosanthes]